MALIWSQTVAAFSDWLSLLTVCMSVRGFGFVCASENGMQTLLAWIGC